MTNAKNTIRTFALVCVAVTSVFVMAMIVWLTTLLADPEWCSRAIGSKLIRPESAFSGCFQLLTQQMSALAINNYIFAGVIALCLLSLMVIVVAGGRISFSGSKDGVSGTIGADDIADAADKVAGAAVDTAEEIKGAQP